VLGDTDDITIFMQEKDMVRALDMCINGLNHSKGNRRMDYVGDLFLNKALSTEALLKADKKWNSANSECLKMYLQAYYIFDMSEEHTKSDKIKKYLQEEYQWAGID
jgi:hypothetical protein